MYIKKGNSYSTEQKHQLKQWKKSETNKHTFQKLLFVKISRITIFVRLRRYLTFCHVYLQRIYLLHTFSPPIYSSSPRARSPLEGRFTAAASKKEDFWCFAGGS